jgi:hypothetical protein
MAYDDPKYLVGPIFATFAAVICTTATKLATCAGGLTDRLEFFRKIKITGFKVLPKTGITQGQAAAGEVYSIRLYATSDIIATAPLLGTNDAGVMANGVIVSSNALKIGANEKLSLKLHILPGGTANTVSPNSINAFIEYQDK